MNFEKIKMVKVLEFISLHSLKSMIRSNELLHIDTPDPEMYFSLPPVSADEPIVLPWRASDRKIPGLTFKDEGIWRGPYFFVLGADTQLGLIDSFKNVTVNPSKFDR